MIVLCIIASLLFSVGEGLRLTPFSTKTVHCAQVQLEVDSTLNAVVEHGPVAEPTPASKRSKRQLTDVEFSPSVQIFEVIPRHPVVDFDQLLSFTATRPLFVADRAPPAWATKDF
jgi:hypothetical protein